MGKGSLPGLLAFILTILKEKKSPLWTKKYHILKVVLVPTKVGLKTRVQDESPAPLTFYCSHFDNHSHM